MRIVPGSPVRPSGDVMRRVGSMAVGARGRAGNERDAITPPRRARAAIMRTTGAGSVSSTK